MEVAPLRSLPRRCILLCLLASMASNVVAANPLAYLFTAAPRYEPDAWMYSRERFPSGAVVYLVSGSDRRRIAPDFAVIDHESRLFEITCPFDLRVRFGLNDNGEPSLYDASGEQGALNPATLAQVVALVPHDQWRHPNRPILQILTPYRFLSDESVYLTQLPPFLHYRDPALPGLVIGGRLPIHIWPRKLNWGFEWHDTQKDLILTRGEPWFYVRFETPDPSQPVRVLEAEVTPDLSEYFAGLDGVVKYVNRTFSLFPVAQQRRPQKLLVPRRPR